VVEFRSHLAGGRLPRPGDAERWARATMRSRLPVVQLLQPRVESCTLESAVAGTAAYIVHLRDDVLGIEADPTEAPESGPAAAELARRLAQAHHAVVTYGSGRPGHFHVLAYVGSSRTEWESHAAALGLRSRVKPALRVPGSPSSKVPRGVSLVPEGDSAETFLRLLERAPRPGTGGAVRGDLLERLHVAPPPSAPRKADGSVDRSRNDMSLITRMVVAGASDAGILAAFETATHSSYWKWREAGPEYLLRALRKARLYAATNPPVVSRHDAMLTLSAHLAHIDAAPLRCFRVSSDKWVALAAVRMGLDQGALSGARLAVDDLALEAGMSPDTTRKARGRFVEYGWLSESLARRARDAQLFAIHAPGSSSLLQQPVPVPVMESEPVPGAIPHSGHPVFRRNALAKSGYELLRHLANGEWWTPADLRRGTLLSESTIHTSLAKCLRHGVVETDGDGGYRLAIPYNWSSLSLTLVGAADSHERQLAARDRRRLIASYDALSYFQSKVPWVNLAERYVPSSERYRWIDKTTGEPVRIDRALGEAYATRPVVSRG
jgi:hypothetical protein